MGKVMELAIHNCCACGMEFVKQRHSQRFCTKRCSMSVAAAKYRKENGLVAVGKTSKRPSHGPFKCMFCGVQFMARQRKSDKYCSRNCAFNEKAERKFVEEIRQAKQRLTWRNGICVTCGTVYRKQQPAQVVCSKACGRAWFNELRTTKRRQNEVCRCGNQKTVIGKYTSRYCMACRLNEAKKRKAIRNLMTVDVDETTTLRRIWTRDGGKCVYCQKETHLGGEQDGNDATRDHIVPISRGGRHVEENIVLACRSCNSHKSASSWEELTASK